MVAKFRATRLRPSSCRRACWRDGSARPILRKRPRRQKTPKINRPDDRSHVAPMLATADPDTDHGPRTDRSATMRMCAVSREVRPVDELIRFVMAPSGEVIADLKRKLPGRGLWISASRQAVAEAVRRHQFSRGFKREVHASPTLATDTEIQLERFAIEALAMAAKAGQVVSGFGKVAEILQGPASPVRALIHASDGAADGIR